MRVVAIVAGIGIGYGLGRLLWIRRHVAFSFWSIIVGIAIVGFVTERMFDAADLGGVWQVLFFPLVVGLGVGLAATSARPPRRAAWWQLWKE